MKVPSIFLVSTAITAEFHSDIDYINKSIGSVLAGTYTVASDIVPITHTQVLFLKAYFLHGESKDFLDFVSTKRSKTLGFFIKSRVLFFDTMLKKHSFDSYSISKFINIFTFRRIIFSLFTVIFF